jgi:hypothetical protein
MCRVNRLRIAPVLLSVALIVGCAARIDGTSPGPSAQGSLAAPPAAAGAPVLRLAGSGVADLAPGPDSIWYVRDDGTDGWLGRVDRGGARVEAAVGPRPIAVAASRESVYVAEAAGDFPERDRQSRIERIDPITLRVLDSTPVHSPTDLLLDRDTIWVATSGGKVLALRASDLELVMTIPVDGRGPARLAAWHGSIWAVNGQTGPPPAGLLQQIEPATRHPFRVIPIEGEGTSTTHALLAGSHLWVATQSSVPGRGLVREVGVDGVLGPAVEIGAPSGLAEAAGRLWWASADGYLGALDVATMSPYGSISVGTGTSAIAAWNDLLWIGTEELIAIRPW